ncbi:hypothetical protein M4D79_25120 [Mycolicibacterium novocastrense]|nr:hypothetical protein M4D79_25120 [Mycolicibacterium novocastrense]
MLGLFLDEHGSWTVDRRSRTHPFAAQQDVGLLGEHLLGQRRICDGDHLSETQNGQFHHGAVTLYQLVHELLAAQSEGRGIQTPENRGEGFGRRQPWRSHARLSHSR